MLVLQLRRHKPVQERFAKIGSDRPDLTTAVYNKAVDNSCQAKTKQNKIIYFCKTKYVIFTQLGIHYYMAYNLMDNVYMYTKKTIEGY